MVVPCIDGTCRFPSPPGTLAVRWRATARLLGRQRLTGMNLLGLAATGQRHEDGDDKQNRHRDLGQDQTHEVEEDQADHQYRHQGDRQAFDWVHDYTLPQAALNCKGDRPESIRGRKIELRGKLASCALPDYYSSRLLYNIRHIQPNATRAPESGEPSHTRACVLLAFKGWRFPAN